MESIALLMSSVRLIPQENTLMAIHNPVVEKRLFFKQLSCC